MVGRVGLRHGQVRWGLERHGRYGGVWLMHELVGRGMAGYGTAGMVGLGELGLGEAGSGRVWQVRSGKVRSFWAS